MFINIHEKIIVPLPSAPLQTKRHTHNLQEGLQLSQRRLHEVLLRLRESPHAASEQLLGRAVELGELIQKLGIERLIVVACHLQLILDTAVFEAVGALLAVVVVQQLVEALLDEFVRPSEHEEELGERVDDQGLCALLLLRERGKGVGRQCDGMRGNSQRTCTTTE